MDFTVSEKVVAENRRTDMSVSPSRAMAPSTAITGPASSINDTTPS